MPGTGPPVVVPQWSLGSGLQSAPATGRPEADRDIDWPWTGPGRGPWSDRQVEGCLEATLNW